jgi:VanZ family protein
LLENPRVTADGKNLLKSWIATILWLALILGESSKYASAENTARFLYPFLHFLLGVSQAHFPVWQFFLRKTGHFVGYFTLSLLLFRSWRATFPLPGVSWTIRWARFPFCVTALVACLDEWHQTHLPNRTGTVHDVLLDSTAALVAQLLLFAILRSRRQESVQAQTPVQNFK